MPLENAPLDKREITNEDIKDAMDTVLLPGEAEKLGLGDEEILALQKRAQYFVEKENLTADDAMIQAIVDRVEANGKQNIVKPEVMLRLIDSRGDVLGSATSRPQARRMIEEERKAA